MTNEEKAREIELDVYAFGEKPKGQFEAPAYRAALAMAEWKDQQFREYLEKKLEWARGNRDFSNLNDPQWHDYVVQVETYSQIINELFGETEQDNSDREE